MHAASLALPPSRARLARTIAPGNTATELPAVLAFERARFLLLTFRTFEPKRTVAPAVTATNRSSHGTAIQTVLWAWRVLATRLALETGRTLALAVFARNRPAQHAFIGALQRARDNVCTRVARETEGASATTVALSDRPCFNAAVLALIFTRLNAFAFGLNLAVRTLARTSLVGRASDRSSIFAAGVFTRHRLAAIQTRKTQRTITTAVLLRNRPSADTTVQAFPRARHGGAARLALPPSRARLARTIAAGNSATELPAVLAFERAWLCLLTPLPGETQGTIAPAVVCSN